MTETTLLTPVEPPTPAKAGKVAVVIGWLLTVLVAALIGMGGVFNILQLPIAKDGAEQMGYPPHVMVPLGWVTIACVVIFLIPQTAVIGALLLTAYLGGAVATHVRMGEPIASFVPAIVFGAVLWIALLFRERRLRPLLLWRKV